MAWLPANGFALEDAVKAPSDRSKISFFLNARGVKMHVRELRPPPEIPTKALVVFFHTLGEHTEAHGVQGFWQKMADQGYYMIGTDMTGHGLTRVTGEPLSLIKDWRHPIDDAVGFIASLYDISATYGPKDDKIPFFICGISTGGMIALNVAIEVEGKGKQGREAFWGNFRGAILLAPVIYQNVDPGKFKTGVLKALNSMGFDKSSLGPKPDPDHFPSREAYESVASDPLCYYGGMLLSTGNSLLQMIKVTQSCLENVRYPFIVLHGINDPVIPHRGSEELLDRSSTPQKDKILKSYIGASHYMLHDSPGMIATYVSDIIAWMESRMQLRLLRQMTQKPEEAPPPSPGRKGGSLKALDPSLISSSPSENGEASRSPTETKSVYDESEPNLHGSSSHSSPRNDSTSQTSTSNNMTPMLSRSQTQSSHLSASLTGTWQKPVTPAYRSRDQSPRSPRQPNDLSNSGSWQRAGDSLPASTHLSEDPRRTPSSSLSSRSDSYSESFVMPRKGSFPMYTVIPTDSPPGPQPPPSISSDLSETATSPRRNNFQIYTANKQ